MYGYGVIWFVCVMRDDSIFVQKFVLTPLLMRIAWVIAPLRERYMRELPVFITFRIFLPFVFSRVVFPHIFLRSNKNKSILCLESTNRTFKNIYIFPRFFILSYSLGLFTPPCSFKTSIPRVFARFLENVDYILKKKNAFGLL